MVKTTDMLFADPAASKNGLSLSRVARPLAAVAARTRTVIKVPAVKSKLHPKNEENQRNLGKYKGELSLMQLASIQNRSKPDGEKISLRQIIHGWWPNPRRSIK